MIGWVYSLCFISAPISQIRQEGFEGDVLERGARFSVLPNFKTRLMQSRVNSLIGYPSNTGWDFEQRRAMSSSVTLKAHGNGADRSIHRIMDVGVGDTHLLSTSLFSYALSIMSVSLFSVFNPECVRFIFTLHVLSVCYGLSWIIVSRGD